MWEGLSLPHDTKFGNCRCKIVESRSLPSWCLIHGLRWSGLIKVGPGDKSALLQVMAWCFKAQSHYLIQRWPRSMSLYGVTRPQWVNLAAELHAHIYSPINELCWGLVNLFAKLHVHIFMFTNQWIVLGPHYWSVPLGQLSHYRGFCIWSCAYSSFSVITHSVTLPVMVGIEQAKLIKPAHVRHWSRWSNIRPKSTRRI